VAGRPRLQIGRPAPFLFVFLDQGFLGFFVLFLGKDAFLLSLIQIDQLLAQGLGVCRAFNFGATAIAAGEHRAEKNRKSSTRR
jgi:hypothetical protein